MDYDESNRASPIRSPSHLKKVNLANNPSYAKSQQQKKMFNQRFEPDLAQKRHFTNYDKEFHSHGAKDLIYNQ